MVKISAKGMTEEEVLAQLEVFRKNDLKWQEGRAFGYVFDPGKDVMAVGKKAYSAFLSENGLDFTVFQSLQRLEKDLAAAGAQHLRGDQNVVGNFTSGGTESIILAVKAARDYYREKRPAVKKPEMILPTTAHAAFHKAAHYLDVKVVTVGVDPQTFKVHTDKVKRAITENTIMLVGSAPSYALGIIDPIAELSDIALEKDLWLHTDACMGGFLLPYFRRLGEPVPDFDFRLPGVSSISMDLHKYAYSPKGASLVLYRNKELRRHQIFACSGWIGYTIINNAVQSSKSGGPMAAAWAVLNYLGDQGYLEIARKKLTAVKKIAAGIEKIDGIRILAEPQMSLVAFTSDTINVFHIIDEMNTRGWYIQPALSYDNSPAHIHLSITASNIGWEDEFLSDLAASVETAAGLPEGNLVKMVRTGLEEVDLSNISDADIKALLAMAGLEGQGLPERMADINGVLDELPAEAREKILVSYVNDLFVQ
ncbi:MAG: aspartate aminotransferase family protein [Thermodesulfobacteriota bacterium]|nr:aspartate aminotransferase family protein [Thermodesulfobacteriota bacterium]